MNESMPLRVGAALLAMALIAAYVVPRLNCHVPLDENCGTDTECACMYGEDQ